MEEEEQKEEEEEEREEEEEHKKMPFPFFKIHFFCGGGPLVLSRLGVARAFLEIPFSLIK